MSRHANQHVRTTLAENICRLRKANGFTQVKLAREIDMDPITVSRWERGQTTPPLTTLLKLAQTFDTDVSQFYVKDAA
jgi:transcriptional regulator with XRE-family HTH domain